MSAYEKGIEAGSRVIGRLLHWLDDPERANQLGRESIVAFLAEQPEEWRCEEHRAQGNEVGCWRYSFGFVDDDEPAFCRMVKARIVVKP